MSQKKISSEQSSIRQIQSEDLEQIVEINQLTQASGWTKDQFQSEINYPESIQYVICEPTRQTEIRGFIFARLITNYFLISIDSNYSNSINQQTSVCELFIIAVDPRFERLGYGSEMLSRLIKSVENKNCREIILEVRSQNSGAISFYEKLGFKRQAERRGYYTQPADDAVIMTRKTDETDEKPTNLN